MGKKVSIAVLFMAVAGACAFVFWPRKPLIFPIGAQEYEVISAHYAEGTNILLATEYPMNQWVHRTLEKVGIQSKRSLRDVPLGGKPSLSRASRRQAVVLLCKGPERGKETFEELHKYEFRVFDGMGREIPSGPLLGIRKGPPGRIWFYCYREVIEVSESPDAQASTREMKPFAPAQLRILHRTDESRRFEWV